MCVYLFSVSSLCSLLGVPSVLRTSVGLRFQCTQIQAIRLARLPAVAIAVRCSRYSLFAHTVITQSHLACIFRAFLSSVLTQSGYVVQNTVSRGYRGSPLLSARSTSTTLLLSSLTRLYAHSEAFLSYELTAKHARPLPYIILDEKNRVGRSPTRKQGRTTVLHAFGSSPRVFTLDILSEMCNGARADGG